ncbi:MAG: hypothetical protein HRU16_04735 [Planctomycetes bacterium]|nr:hypothetical protein [Planctomycetota bacterium]
MSGTNQEERTRMLSAPTLWPSVIMGLFLFLVTGCAGTPLGIENREVRLSIARLGSSNGDPEGFASLRSAYRLRNPGHDVSFQKNTRALVTSSKTRAAFVQTGEARAEISGGALYRSSDLAVGDIVVLRPGEGLLADEPLSFVVFEIPDNAPVELPSYVRPDWDPTITDTPGGCAEEEGAYRRILLTWKPEVGPYIWHGINAHRVRISDSFTHYHPVVGGFDEFYLVQMVQQGGSILTSPHVEAIESRNVTRDEAPDLMRRDYLSVGDLVYLPRGLIHRGVGGVLAQVITVPGFRPGAEIGVDHHLRAINEQLQLTADVAIPYHQSASLEAVVK